ncbi:antibiotic biosynthesis monooxygenase [Rubrobacter taiwanensis]|jgi:heme-degrading monooxygenase HmoA|uniref:Antibiotic biosynthesis monooxygenase n=1 Tax=Rubrobacter taiwanensis TaxID=185139 RepID=A0A4R1BHU8_9ACTN|nr:antibiotic biosynthesis monooxygenase [Rubrobacter taiwanensis]TCJ16801.1 antibiotic biosynthesis monooxygenase [Rubrobacter taiwanensis]
MIAVMNRLPVREGAAGELVDMFATSRGAVQDFPGFVSMEVMRSEDEREVVVITWWESREAFEKWVESESFRRAHGRSGAHLLTGHPQMTTYAVEVRREPGEKGGGRQRR